ncbi:hypothetical protein CRG98_018393 [Punica granatum]|nr:hypothetical protein CRG98_018393 [Punica granatum]
MRPPAISAEASVARYRHPGIWLPCLSLRRESGQTGLDNGIEELRSEMQGALNVVTDELIQRNQALEALVAAMHIRR